ncbi:MULTISPECIES: O-succinylhomoserine sulfhydrylase [unclassified Devosia]|jgi:O-succinylhomoserine sulfhydrylase|uniref:O-succinylhomoserine sulfhydrylase n=1 Tax=unclassified Devosia TaxID=196773 RepID=UPI00086CACAF|nr:MULTISPECIES: O-succinylhomoserine sulfhydrylase [unclassified Devosia]MBN9360946.1 O-succinylhomoserine sulfhydrylase [Devosia sp.]ODS86204.1 MAG: O-succinylhomoserine sulfhydrylase [Devosia sp. SCN 66-27]OJX22889.1 MAG: O-succinylhomoserine sulfhydrylase [Devosia sp. 66-14]
MSKSKNPLNDEKNRSPATQVVHGGTQRSQFKETSEAIFMNSGYSYPSSQYAEDLFLNKINKPAHNYSRFANPTMDMFQDRMALLEGAEAARAFATGMSAVTNAVMSQVRAGDHIVAARALFGGCRYVVEDLMPRFGVNSTLVDGRDPENFARAMRENTKVIFIETPTNPTLELVDIAAVAKIAKAHGAKLIVDNVFATALFQKPLQLGADLVTYSATKHIDGQGRALGGIVLGSKELIEGDVHTLLRQTGPSLSPFNAWVLLKGIETLPIRVRQMTEGATKVADFLAGHPKIERVSYPFHPSHPQYELAKRQMKSGSTLVAFEVKGGREAAFTLSDSLAVILISNNLGDAKSLITHPGTTTHARFTEEVRLESGITPGLLRLSVGLEDADDLIKDLEYGLSQV